MTTNVTKLNEKTAYEKLPTTHSHTHIVVGVCISKARADFIFQMFAMIHVNCSGQMNINRFVLLFTYCTLHTFSNKVSCDKNLQTIKRGGITQVSYYKSAQKNTSLYPQNKY